MHHIFQCIFTVTAVFNNLGKNGFASCSCSNTQIAAGKFGLRIVLMLFVTLWEIFFAVKITRWQLDTLSVATTIIQIDQVCYDIPN